jgi:hypothetical protein
LAFVALLAVGAIGVLLTGPGSVAAALGAFTLAVLLRALYESGRGVAAVHGAVCEISASETRRSPQTETPTPVVPGPTIEVARNGGRILVPVQRGCGR